MHPKQHSQPRAVYDFVVHGEFTPSVVDDHDPHTAASVCKRVIEPRPQPSLINDGKTLLDVPSLCHCYNPSVFTDVEHTVGFEDRTQHVLYNHGWGRVGDKAGFLL